MFTHLHVHTEYSLLDGACRIERAIDAAKKMGQTALAITDHGNMYGVVDFYKAAKKKGIKPIIGCEVYVAKRTRHDKVHEFDYENRHLVLLCENQIGYQNLIAIVSKAWTEGFYNKPRVDFELLEKHHEGIIALSACLAGEIPRALSAGDYEGAKAAAIKYRDIFGENNFFLELQDHGLADQKRVNPGIIRISKETGIPLVVTNDSHYIEKEDSKMHHILICIQTNRTVEDEDVLEFGSNEFYLKSEEEMRGLFPDYPEAADNTALIAERCNVEFEFGKTKLPAFTTPDGSDNKEFFINLCLKGFNERYGENPDKSLVDRLNYEISVIDQMGYINYFLIVYDFIRYAKSMDIPVGAGRGSGVGSIVAYCMGITGVDPVKYDLIFERFLNPERVSMPDFDIDFSDERRSEIIDYVIDKYGADHVAQIVTFGTMAAKQALRDVGRAMAVPYAKVDVLAKLVPFDLKITLEKALGSSKDFKKRYDEDPEAKELIDMAMKIEGMPRHASTHAAGVVITDKPVMEYVPLAKNDDSVVTQFTMTTIEELGLLKMDFLGLRNLSIIDHAEQMIRRREPSFSVAAMPEDDKETYELISSGYTDGVFQFESAGMRRLIVQVQPSGLEDLIAIISLYRPGPMNFIPMYIRNIRNPKLITYRHERLKKILDVTYGCIIYQEQVMQIFRELAGYSLGRADIVRRAMSKKKHDVLNKEKQFFIHGLKREDGTYEIEGCINRGVDEKTAEVIFGEIESFASYAFNKSHAAAYAVLAYQTAYLKCHYPREYMAALLSSVLGSGTKVSEYVEECGRLNIKILPPHVNCSERGFTVTEDGIRYGLLAIKNLGVGAIERLVHERRGNGEYTSFVNFCKRIQGKDINKRAVESLIKCGALDGLGNNRRELFLSMEMVMQSFEMEGRRNIEGQMGFFDNPELSGNEEAEVIAAEDFTSMQKLAFEKEVTGMYISGHPMTEYSELYKLPSVARIDKIHLSSQGEIAEYRDNQRVTIVCMIMSAKTKLTKSNQNMAFLDVEDMFGSIEVLVFPTILERFTGIIEEGKIVAISGRISFTEEKEPKILADSIEQAEGIESRLGRQVSSPPASVQKGAENRNHGNSANGNEIGNGKTAEKKSKRTGLYLKVSSETDPMYKKALKYIAVFDGYHAVYVRFTDTGKMMRAPAVYNVSVNEILLRELKKLLGDENVVFLDK